MTIAQGCEVAAPGYKVAALAPTQCELSLDSIAFGQKREVVLKVAPVSGAEPASGPQV